MNILIICQIGLGVVYFLVTSQYARYVSMVACTIITEKISTESYVAKFAAVLQ